MRLKTQRPTALEAAAKDAGDESRGAWSISKLIPPPDVVAVVAFLFVAATGLSLSGETGLGGSDAVVRHLHPAPVEGLDVAPDGRTVVSASRDGTVKVWTLGSDDEGRVIATSAAGFSSIALSPDGRCFVAGGLDGVGVVCDAGTGAVRASLGGHKGAIRGVAFAPDGSVVATSGDDGSVRIYDAVNGDERRVLSGHSGSVRGLAFAPDSRMVVSAGLDGRLVLWDVGSGAIRERAQPGLGGLRAAAFSPDGRFLAFGGAEGVGLRDMETGRTETGRSEPDLVAAVHFLDGGATLVSAGWTRAVTRWDVRAGLLASPSRRIGHGAKINAMAVLPDGVTLLTGSQAGAVETWPSGGPRSGR